MFKSALIIFLLFCQTFLFASPIPSSGSFNALQQPPFVIHYVGKDLVYAKEAVKILSNAYDELAFDFQFEPARQFDVYIMPTRQSFRQALEGRLPDWTGAFATPMYNRMVVKSPRWNPDNSFENSLVHELVHLVIHSYLGVRDVPRWLDEGLAIFYSGEQRWTTTTALSKAISTNSLIPLSDIDAVLEYHQIKADLAYQQSYSAVRYLLRTYDIDAMRQILTDIKMGVSLQKSFFTATGSTLDDFEKEWQNYVRKTYKWMWIYEIQDYIWLLIFVLVVLAFVARIFHNKRIEKRWQEEQKLAEKLRLDELSENENFLKDDDPNHDENEAIDDDDQT